MVDLVPRRAATAACTIGFSCSNSAFMDSSVLANANVSLPVRRLILVGGVAPYDSSNLANCGLLISTLLSNAPRANSFFACTSDKCFSSTSVSRYSVGSENMRMVKSISFSSNIGKSPDIAANNAYVSATSFSQYLPYCANCSASKFTRRRPLASFTSVPLTPNP